MTRLTSGGCFLCGWPRRTNPIFQDWRDEGGTRIWSWVLTETENKNDYLGEDQQQVTACCAMLCGVEGTRKLQVSRCAQREKLKTRDPRGSEWRWRGPAAISRTLSEETHRQTDSKTQKQQKGYCDFEDKLQIPLRSQFFCWSSVYLRVLKLVSSDNRPSIGTSKHFMDIAVRFQVCDFFVFFLFFIFALTLAKVFCCISFIYWCLEIGNSSIDWLQLNRLHLKTETEFSLRNVVFKIKTGRWIMSRNTISELEKFI
jgi:hypothetical protein